MGLLLGHKMGLLGLCVVVLLARSATATTFSPATCCKDKSVGGVSYSLVEETDTVRYGCKSNCVYEMVARPGSRICFKEGNLQVVCEESDSGPGDKWKSGGIVPNKLAMAPPTGVESGALYTVFFIDHGIERLEGLQYVHWLVTNV